MEMEMEMDIEKKLEIIKTRLEFEKTKQLYEKAKVMNGVDAEMKYILRNAVAEAEYKLKRLLTEVV